MKVVYVGAALALTEYQRTGSVPAIAKCFGHVYAGRRTMAWEE